MFAEQSGIPLIYLNENVRNKRTNRVAGSYTASDALEILLIGTGIDGSFNERRVLTVTVKKSGDDVDSEFVAEIDRTPEGKGGSVKKRGLLAGIIAVLAGSPVSADQAAEAKPTPTELNEILVTAQKREERLVDVPQSVMVLSADSLAAAGATQLRDFASTVPGLAYSTNGAGFNQISLRGVTTGIDNNPTVGVYFDEVPYGSSTAFAFGGRLGLDAGLFDIDRIEVLRGPQGTLYGASAMGGLFKYVTTVPDTNEFTGELRGGISSTRHGGVGYNAAAALNFPLATNQAGLRVTGYYNRDGGFIDNLALGREDVDQAGIHGLRADLLFTPTDRLSIRLAGFAQDIARDGESTADYTLAGVPIDGDLQQRRLYEEPFDQKFRLASATLEYDFGPVTAISVSSYQNLATESFVDVSPQFAAFFSSGDGLGRPISAVGLPFDVDTEKFAQEFRLASAGDTRLRWVLGAFYTNEESTYSEAFVAREPSGASVPENLYTSRVPTSYEELAAFGNVTLSITEQFEISAGVRHAVNELSFLQEGSGILGANAPEQRSEESVTTYLANVLYRLTPRVSAYARYATGYRPGGPNFAGIDPTTGQQRLPLTFASDSLDSYEIGLRGDVADRSFAFDLAAYSMDWHDIQASVSRGGFGVIVNVPGGATIRGAEVVLTARPTDRFTVTSALAFQDAELAADSVDLRAARGTRLPNVPELTATVSTDYEFALPAEPSLGASLRFVADRLGRFNFDYELPSYTTFDLRAGATLGPVRFQIYANNVFDERGQYSVIFRGIARVATIEPRTIGINAITRF